MPDRQIQSTSSSMSYQIPIGTDTFAQVSIAEMMGKHMFRASSIAISILLMLAIVVLDHPGRAGTNSTVPTFRSMVMKSRASGRSYLVLVSVPDEAVPPAGYPVFYMTDGNDGCPLAAAISATLSVYILQKPVIVCVGYPDASPMEVGKLRVHDLIDAPQEPLPAGSWPGLATAGGAAAFADFLEFEVKPVIERHYHVDRSRQALFGHSLGGWFALHEFLVHPARYDSYVAGSPSLWWNTSEIYTDLDKASRIDGGRLASRLLLEVGSREDAVDEAPPDPGKPRIDYRMIDHFRQISRLLQQKMPGRSQTRLIDGESHSSAWAPEVDHGLVFAFGPSRFADRER